MRRPLLLTVCFLLASVSLRAQSLTPEWSLPLQYQETPAGVTATLVIGYDARATDAYDSSFGEVEMPPFSGPDNSLINQEYPADSLSWTATKINIMHKPSADSFAIQYKINVRPSDKTVGHLSWDASKLPPQIKGIQVTPWSYPSMFLVDMLKQSNFDVNVSISQTDPHSCGVWIPAVITVYYNMQPQFGGASGVAPSSTSTSLISLAEVYPNPLTTAGKLHLAMSDAAHLTIVGYDVAGRVCIRTSAEAIAGQNEIDLSTLAKSRGAIMLHIDATNASRHETRNIMVMSE
jgi:hypothetical protein